MEKWLVSTRMSGGWEGSCTPLWVGVLGGGGTRDSNTGMEMEEI